MTSPSVNAAALAIKPATSAGPAAISTTAVRGAAKPAAGAPQERNTFDYRDAGVELVDAVPHEQATDDDAEYEWSAGTEPVERRAQLVDGMHGAVLRRGSVRTQ